MADFEERLHATVLAAALNPVLPELLRDAAMCIGNGMSRATIAEIRERLKLGATAIEALQRATRDRDRHPGGDETRSGSVERSEIEPGPKASPNL